MKRNRPSKSGDSPVKIVFLSLSILVIVGIFVCVFLAPSEYVNGPSTNSVISGTSSDLALSQRILDWLPRYHVDEQQASPNWNLEFWTPIDVDVSSEPIVILCKLNFRKYSESPHLYPMFKDLVSLSSCKGSNRQRKLLSTALKEIQGKDSVDVVKPTGFVFHESRVGSTLIANALASDPWSIIFSESAPIANAIMHAGHLTTEKQVQLLQDVVTVMGHSPIHKRLFFKFQSITVTKMELVLKVYDSIR